MNLKTKSGHEFIFHKGNDSCIIFLHGMDEWNSLDKVATRYLPLYLKNGWKPEFSVACPRNTHVGKWSNDLIDEVIDEVVKMGVSPDKIGMWGYSNGGGGVLYYLCQENPKHEISMACICAAYWPHGAPNLDLITIPIGIFHAVDDKSVSISRSRLLKWGIKNSPELIYVEYPGGGHSGAGNYTFKPGVKEAELMYNKFRQLGAPIPQDEIITNPTIHWNKTKDLLILNGTGYKLVKDE
jgi:predicted esterase